MGVFNGFSYVCFYRFSYMFLDVLRGFLGALGSTKTTLASRPRCSRASRPLRSWASVVKPKARDGDGVGGLEWLGWLLASVFGW